MPKVQKAKKKKCKQRNIAHAACLVTKKTPKKTSRSVLSSGRFLSRIGNLRVGL